MKTTKLGRRGVLAGGLALAGASKLAARVPGNHALPAGTPLRLKLPPVQHLFEANTGLRRAAA